MKIAILYAIAMASLASLAQAARKKPIAAAAAPPPSPPLPRLNPVQSNPPDPGDAFQPRTQSGCLSNIGINQPTGGAYYHQGDTMTLVILADMFLPQSNTAAEIVDASNNNTVATLIPTFPTLNYTTITTTMALPTAVTPGTYSVRFHQTYSNTFASGMRSQTMQVQMIVVSSGASTPPPLVTNTVNALGLTVLIPRGEASSAPTPPPGGSTPGSSNTAPGSAPTGANSSSPGSPAASPTGTASTTSFSIVIAVLLGFVGFLAAL